MRVMTLNIRNVKNNWERRRTLLVDVVLTERPDVIALQEVVMLPTQDQATWIANELSNRFRTMIYTVNSARAQGVAKLKGEGISILTRLQVVEHRNIEFPRRYNGGSAQCLTIETDGQNVNVINTRLAKDSKDEPRRKGQVEYLLQWMNENCESSVLLVGDLNALPFSPTVRTITDRLENAFVKLHGYYPKTFPTPLRLDVDEETRAGCIDYIFYDAPSFQIKDVKVLGTVEEKFFSDHYALFCELLPKQGTVAQVDVTEG